MNLRSIRIVLLFCVIVVGNILLLETIEERTLQINCFSYETAYRNFRNHEIPEAVFEQFWNEAADIEEASELLTMYFATDSVVTDTELLRRYIDYAKKYQYEDFMEIKQGVYAVWNDLKCFPVGKVASNPSATITFADSWMQSRTFGGNRGHEGCDLMATFNQRGIYPVYSISDGTVENIGWLRLGGYRIGIRSYSGAYFYYAHLAEYAREFEIGESVTAGTLLGYMGDTGYSDIPGTTGMFDVHLHLGIYLNHPDGTEFSVNPYPVVRYLEEREKNR